MEKTELEELLDFYEIEISNLEQVIQEYVEEGDYEDAYLTSAALQLAKNKVMALNRLNDPDYERKYTLTLFKGQYEKALQNKDIYIKEFYDDQLFDINKELEARPEAEV